MSAPSELKFFVAGLPKGQPRVKAFKRGNHAGVYDPGTADAWKGCIRADFRALTFATQKPIFTGPVAVTLAFKMPRPKSHLRANGERKPTAPGWHTGKPDVDNLAKAILDALTNAGAWPDDNAVAVLAVSKQYQTTMSGCEITIDPLPEKGPEA